MQLQIDKKCNQNWNEMADANAQQKFWLAKTTSI